MTARCVAWIAVAWAAAPLIGLPTTAIDAMSPAATMYAPG